MTKPKADKIILGVVLAILAAVLHGCGQSPTAATPIPSPSPIVAPTPAPPTVYASINVCARKNGVCVTDWHPGDGIRMQASATCAKGDTPETIKQVDCPPFKDWIWQRDLSDVSTQTRWEGELFSDDVVVVCDGIGTFRTVVQPELFTGELLDKSQIFAAGVR